jgi:hypothetical protein
MVASSGSSSFAIRIPVVMAAPAAAATIQIHFFDLPELCRGGGVYVERLEVDAVRCVGL